MYLPIKSDFIFDVSLCHVTVERLRSGQRSGEGGEQTWGEPVDGGRLFVIFLDTLSALF